MSPFVATGARQHKLQTLGLPGIVFDDSVVLEAKQAKKLEAFLVFGVNYSNDLFCTKFIKRGRNQNFADFAPKVTTPIIL